MSSARPAGALSVGGDAAAVVDGPKPAVDVRTPVCVPSFTLENALPRDQQADGFDAKVFLTSINDHGTVSTDIVEPEA